MKITNQWLGGRCFAASNEHGHSIITDGSGADTDGQKRGASPMELLLMGAAGCAGIDVVEILRKQRQQLTDCRTTVSAKRAQTAPKVFTEIHLHFDLHGKNLNPQAVAKAVALSAEKYCSASIMLGKTAKITHSFTVGETE